MKVKKPASSAGTVTYYTLVGRHKGAKDSLLRKVVDRHARWYYRSLQLAQIDSSPTTGDVWEVTVSVKRLDENP